MGVMDCLIVAHPIGNNALVLNSDQDFSHIQAATRGLLKQEYGPDYATYYGLLLSAGPQTERPWPVPRTRCGVVAVAGCYCRSATSWPMQN